MPTLPAAALDIHRPHPQEEPRALPLYSSRVPAGFPSPAEDHLGDTLDLHTLLVQRPAATFFVRVSGDSLHGVGVHDGDILVVDRSLQPADGQVIIAILDGEMTVKILSRRNGRVRLLAANPRYPDFELAEGQQLEVWGVVTALVRPGLAQGARTGSSTL